jgi:hypothetical protein
MKTFSLCSMHHGVHTARKLRQIIPMRPLNFWKWTPLSI